MASVFGANCIDERRPSWAVPAPANDILGLDTCVPASDRSIVSLLGTICSATEASSSIAVEVAGVGEESGDGDLAKAIVAD